MDDLPPISLSIGPNTAVISETHSPPMTTALAIRSTEDVIADLRRPLVTSSLQPSHPPTSLSSLSNELALSVAKGRGSSHEQGDLFHESDESGDEEDDDYEEIHQPTKPGKVSERKRRLNAIADQYIQTSLEKSIRVENKMQPEVEAQQSAKWHVNQTENREIISTPREYQTELFERAKEKNIIAVLETGLFHSWH
jgi:endoribonuclease Dicer